MTLSIGSPVDGCCRFIASSVEVTMCHYPETFVVTITLTRYVHAYVRLGLWDEISEASWILSGDVTGDTGDTVLLVLLAGGP